MTSGRIDPHHVTDRDVADALADPNPNEIANQVAAVMESYMLALQRQAQRAGGWPSPLRIAESANAVERAALRLFRDQLRETTGARINIDFRKI